MTPAMASRDSAIVQTMSSTMPPIARPWPSAMAPRGDAIEQTMPPTVPPIARRLPAALALALLLAPALAAAHGGEPTVTGLRFPPNRPGEVWAITDNQGLYAALPGGTAWLCEDAVAPAAGIHDIAVLDREGRRWLILTEEGLFATDDGGCSYAEAPPDLADQTVRALSAHPTRPGEVVAVTETFGAANDAWRTTDGGATWTPAGIALRGRFTALLRSEADPERLYALHDRAAYTSADAGRTWTPITLADPPALPSAAHLLAAPPGAPGRLWIAVEALPGSAVYESVDAGARWREALRVDDLELALAFDRAGREALIVTPFDGARRSLDGGRTWAAGPLPVDRLQRIARAPDSDRLWGSTGLFFGGPWALAHSDDFGRTWTPTLPRFEDVDRRWQCPEQSPATRCCATLCPGLPPEGICEGQRADDGAACTTPPAPPLGPLPGDEPDMGAADAMVDAAVDAMVDVGDAMASDAVFAAMPDAIIDATLDATVDATLDAAPRDAAPPLDVGDPRDQGRIAPDVTVIAANPPADGCQQSPRGGGARPWLCLLALPWLRRRRSTV